tara:strand:- start:143 stop:400 length:258 start_codon:yes stop_codon:yes gene_type:complete
MKYLVVAIMVSLAWLHHDWWWDDLESLAPFGIPMGLGYHVGFSFATAAAWALAVYQAWPKELERWADNDGRRHSRSRNRPRRSSR